MATTPLAQVIKHSVDYLQSPGFVGSIVTGVLASTAAAAIPGGLGLLALGVGQNLFASSISEGIQHVTSHWHGGQDVNHHLQRSLAKAVREALVDVGGPACFPDQWRGKGSRAPFGCVLPEARGAQCPTAVRDLLLAVDEEIKRGRLLPLDPLPDREASNAESYLATFNGRPIGDLGRQLYALTVADRASHFPEAFRQSSCLQEHLETHLLDRTLSHLPNILKSDAEAWRAFTRWMLQDLLVTVKQGQQEQAEGFKEQSEALKKLEERVEVLLTSPGRADLDRIGDAAAGALGKLVEGQDALGHTVADAFAELREREDRQFTGLRDDVQRNTDVILLALSGLAGDMRGIGADVRVLGLDLRALREEIRALRKQTAPEVKPKDLIDEYLARLAETLAGAHDLGGAFEVGPAGVDALRHEEIYIRQLLAPAQLDGSARGDGEDPLTAWLGRGQMIVLGEPGAGKTVLVRHLALRLADGCRPAADGSLPAGAFLPLLVSLAGWGQLEPALSTPVNSLLRQARHQAGELVPEVAPLLDELIAAGRVAFLCDGLDEAGTPAVQRGLVERLATWRDDRAGGCPVLVTSRIEPYVGEGVGEGGGVYTSRLLTLTPANRPDVIRRWLGALLRFGRRGADIVDQEAQKFETWLAAHPHQGDALSSPLLLGITLAAWVEGGRDEDAVPGMAARFGGYIERFIGRRDDGVWPDKARLWAGLETLGATVCGGAGWVSQAAAEAQICTALGFDTGDARRFVLALVDAGLLRQIGGTAAAGPQETLLAFAPHSLFGDYFAGRGLAAPWRKDQAQAKATLRRRADEPAWQQAVLFALSHLWESEPVCQPIFDFVVSELERKPAWGVRCLHEGLEITVDEMAARDRGAIVTALQRKAKELLHPEQLERLEKRLGEDGYRANLALQFEALEAMGRLHLCELVDELLVTAMKLRDERDHFDMRLRDALEAFGPECMGDLCQELLADRSAPAWLRYEAAQIVGSWRTPAGVSHLLWMLENATDVDHAPEFAIAGLANVPGPEIDHIFDRLLRDGRYAEDALHMALLARRPNLVDRAIALLTERREEEVGRRFLLEYVSDRSPAEIRKVVAALLPGCDAPPFGRFFEVGGRHNLPLLRELVPFLRHPDPHLCQAAENAFHFLFKGDRWEAGRPELRPLIETAMFEAQDSAWQEAAQGLRSAPLSFGAEARLAAMLSGDRDEQHRVLQIVGEGVALRPQTRAAIAAWLKGPAAAAYDEAYRLGMLARVDDTLPTADLLALLARAASPFDYSVPALDTLARRGEAAAFPYVMRCLAERDDLGWDAVLWLTHLAAALDAAQRRAAATAVRAREARDREAAGRVDLPAHLIATRAFAALGALSPAEMIGQLLENTAEVQEAAIGTAIASYYPWSTARPDLEAALARRDEVICMTALRALGEYRQREVVTVLLRVLTWPSDYLQTADHLLSHGDLASALRYVQGRAAFSLGRVVARSGLAAGRVADLPQEWGRLASGPLATGVWQAGPWATGGPGATAPRAAGAPGSANLSAAKAPGSAGVEEAWRAGLAALEPSQALFASALAAPPLAEPLTFLLAAFEWSEWFRHLEARPEMDTPATWRLLTSTLDEAGSSAGEVYQAQLVRQVDWPLPRPPFAYLFQLGRNQTHELQRTGRIYAHREAREWAEWLEWAERFLRSRG